MDFTEQAERIVKESLNEMRARMTITRTPTRVNAEAIEEAIFHNTLLLVGKNADGGIYLYDKNTGEVVIDGLNVNQK